MAASLSLLMRHAPIWICPSSSLDGRILLAEWVPTDREFFAPGGGCRVAVMKARCQVAADG